MWHGFRVLEEVVNHLGSTLQAWVGWDVEQILVGQVVQLKLRQRKTLEQPRGRELTSARLGEGFLEVRELSHRRSRL